MKKGGCWVAALSHKDSEGQSVKGRRAVRARGPTRGCPPTRERLCGSSPRRGRPPRVPRPLRRLNARPSRGALPAAAALGREPFALPAVPRLRLDPVVPCPIVLPPGCDQFLRKNNCLSIILST